MYIPDGHHAKGNVARGSLVSAAHMVDFVGLGENHVVMLEDNGVRVDAAL